MNFMGRWVPMNVVDTIVLLWLITSLLVVGVMLWFRRRRQPTKTGHAAARVSPHGKRSKRKQR